MGQEEKPIQSFNKRNFALKLLLAVFLVLGTITSIFFLGRYYAEEILNEIVRTETNGYYTLGFTSLDLDLLDKRIEVSEMKLIFDTTRNIDSLGINNVYEIDLEKLVIDLESIVSFYLDKELVIQNVRVIDPSIQMIKVREGNKTNFSFEAGTLYQVISDYLQILKIDHFRIQGGNVAYQPGDFSLGNIDFMVQNLLLDSTRSEGNVFYSESIELEVSNQHFYLPDGVHEISFDRFILSTSDSLLSFENFKIQPTVESGVTFSGVNELNVYDIEVPLLQLKGVDYISAYRDNHLIVDELKLAKPKVFLDNKSKSNRSQSQSDNSLLALLFQVFDAVDIKKLSVNESNLDLKINNGDKYQRLQTDHCGLVFYNVHLDTATYQFNQRNRYFDNIEVNIQNYSYLLPDSLHEINFERLELNSFKSFVRFQDLTIAPNRSTRSSSKALIDVNIPELNLSGVDYLSMLNQKLIVKELEILKPKVEVRGSNQVDSQNAVIQDVTSLFKLIEPQFKLISIDLLDLNSANLRLPKGLNIRDASFQSRNVVLNNKIRNWSELIHSTKVQVGGFSLDRDSIKVEGEKLFSASNLTQYQLENWKIDVEEAHQKVHLKFDTLSIAEMNLDSLLHGDFLHFKKATLTNPRMEVDIHHENSKRGNASKIDLGPEKELIVVDGHFEVVVDAIELSIKNIDGDIFTGDSTAFRSLSLEELDLTASRLNQHVAMKKWSYDTTNGQMEFFDLVINPIDEADTTKNYLTAEIPYLDLIGFEQAKFFDDKHFFASTVVMDRPFFSYTIHQDRKNADSSQKEENYTFAIENLLIDSAGVEVVGSRQSQLDSLSLQGLFASILNFKYPENSFISNNTILFGEQASFSIQKITPVFRDNTFFEGANFQYNSISSDFRIDSVNFRSNDQSQQVSLPNVQIANLNTLQLYDSNAFMADSLRITDAKIKVYNKGTAEKMSFDQQIDLKVLSLSNASVEYMDTIKDQNIKINQGSLFVKDLFNKGALQVEKIPSTFSLLTFSGRDFTYPISPEYDLEISKYAMNLPEGNLVLDEVMIDPTYTAEEYTLIINKQADWFNVSVDSIVFSGLDFLNFASNNQILLDKVNAANVDAIIYRDKSLPFPEDQVGKLPQEMIREIPFGIKIDTVAMTGNIAYQEHPKDYEAIGEISFNNLEASLYNFSNLDSSPDQVMSMDARGRLMESGEMTAKALFLLNHPAQQFSLGGSIRDFSLDSLNRMLGPVANVNIKSGYSDELTFQFNANDSLARGGMTFRYNDLKIQILNTKNHDTQGFGRGIKTFFANTFVVKNKNPTFLLFPRKGVIFQERDPQKAIFSYWGKSLLSGVVSSVGIHKSNKAEKKFDKKTDDK